MNEMQQGLSFNEARARLEQFGPNELQSTRPRSMARIAWETAKEPMFLLLISCALVYVAIGDPQEASILGAAVLVVVGITFFQERRTERALDSLRDLSSPRALVIRDGKSQRIAGREVVPGDIVLISEGDRVPADAAVLEAHSLCVDESLLTGESVPVTKSEWSGQTAPVAAGGEDSPFVYSGTLAVQGRAILRVLATGDQAALGRIRAVKNDQLPALGV